MQGNTWYGAPRLTALFTKWILRARDRDRDILARLRFGHQRPLNRRCPARLGHQRPVNRGCPRVSKPVSQDIQSICYCLHTGIFRLDTCDLVVAGVRISISPKYLYLYLTLKVLTFTKPPVSRLTAVLNQNIRLRMHVHAKRREPADAKSQCHRQRSRTRSFVRKKAAIQNDLLGSFCMAALHRSLFLLDGFHT